MPTNIKKRRAGPQAAGFTLVEVTISIIIVGIGIVAMLLLFTSGTQVNSFGNQLSTAVFLAEEMRAMTDQADFAELTVYDNLTFNGVDAGGNNVAGLESYRQQITVQPVNPDDLAIYIGPNPQAAIITATVSQDGSEITRLCWLRTH